MKRSTLSAWAWLLAVFAMAPAVGAEAFAQERTTVSKVLDHSTIVVSRNEKITLIGVDKPPTGAFTVRDAKDNLDDILRGKEVMLVADPLIPDAKGVKARYVFLGGELVNQRLIAQGFAGVRRDAEFSRLETFLEVQDVARRMKTGAWVLDGQTNEEQFSLSVAPNPVTEVAMLQYRIPEPANVTLLVLDSSNRVVASLVNARMEAGNYTAVFQRLRLPDGRYTCQLTAGSRVVAEPIRLTGRSTTGSDAMGGRNGTHDRPASPTSPTSNTGVQTAAAPAETAVPERKTFRLPGGGPVHTSARP